jgi:hypothetical protein
MSIKRRGDNEETAGFTGYIGWEGCEQEMFCFLFPQAGLFPLRDHVAQRGDAGWQCGQSAVGQ